MASNPRVAVDIAAVDQFTATLNKFRRDLTATGNTAALVDRKFGGMALPSLGIGQARQELNAFHSQAARQIGSITRMVPGLGALGGIASVAGLGDMVTRYAGLGVELKNVAQVAGTSAAGMDSLRGAARMLGLSAGTADQAMVGLNKTLADAAFGKNPEAANWFNRFGIGLKNAAGGAATAETALPKIANVFQTLMKSDPRAAVTFADKIGLGSEAINLLGIGAERLAALRKEAAELSGITDEGQASSEKFAGAMGRVGIAADRVGRTIATTLEPVVAPMLTEFSVWTSQHAKEVQDGFRSIAMGIGAVALAAPGAMKRLHDYGEELDSVFEKIRRLGEDVGADKVGKWLKELWNGPSADEKASVFDPEVFLKLKPEEQKQYLDDIGNRPGFNRQVNPGRYGAPGGAGGGSSGFSASDATMSTDRAARGRAWHDEFVKQGMGDVQAWGAAANVLHENGGMVGGKPGDGGASTGALQWNGTRRANYRAMFGHDPGEGTMAENAKFLMWELKNTESGNAARFNAARAVSKRSDSDLPGSGVT